MGDFIRLLPLRGKLLFTIILAFVVMVALLSVNLSTSLNGMKDDLVKQTRQTMVAEVLARLDSEASNLGNKIGGYINSVYRIPVSLANNLANSSAKGGEGITREHVNNLVSSTLASHKDISSMYAQFEPNGYDPFDADNIGSEAIYNVADTGALEIYWIRNQAGQLEQNRVEDSAEKYNAEVGEFGIREAEWYLCSKDKGMPCIAEPYMYEITPEYSELMTSLTVPVMVAGKFKGLVGVDVNLPIFQQLTEGLSKSLYKGASRITLLSEKGLIVSSSHYKEKLTRPLSEARDTLSDKLLNLHKQGTAQFIQDGTIYVASSINIPASDSTWSVLIELPEEVPLASTLDLITTIDKSILSIISSGLVLSVIVAGLVMMVLIALVRSIVQPIQKLDDMVQNLASADGDLTQDLRLNTHAELISLSRGFNQFIVKLREMVRELKHVGDTAKGSAIKGKEINMRSLNATNEQQREIDSVVTATNEMSATASEVSQVAVTVADNAKNALATVLSSQKSLSGSVTIVQGLTQDMGQASKSISEVAARTEDINRILDVIRAIAEQTNLLALNAAIEAARAGEQGRGFAVVADEVRSLASKTQASTEEINQMIQGLKGGVNQAVAVIESSTHKAQGAMDETQSSYDSLTSVVSDISSIADNISQVATAAEEQSAVSEEVSRNLTIIGDAAKALAEMAHEGSASSDALENEMGKLDKQLASLKT